MVWAGIIQNNMNKFSIVKFKLNFSKNFQTMRGLDSGTQQIKLNWKPNFPDTQKG